MVVAHQPEREAMPFAERPDARIWWDQSGTGDPVLLIMGHAYGADMWHRTARELAASYRVIRFDNRGVGRSSDPPGPYPVQLMAGDALAVLDAASAASAHVYGVSMGGAIALQLALDHPGRVRSLTLGCTAASAEGASRGALLTRVRTLVPAAALNRMAGKLLYGPDTPASRRAEDQQIVRRFVRLKIDEEFERRQRRRSGRVHQRSSQVIPPPRGVQTAHASECRVAESP